jgi:LPS O-antigen subunit length determinant protein (WzzB/FepE family)
MSESDANRKSDVYEVDLAAIFAIFWRRRKLILLGTLAVTLLVGAISFIIPKTYRSEGFYQLGNPEKRIEKNNDKDKDKEKDKDKDKETVSEENVDVIGIPIPLYKKRAPQFFDPDRLQLFAGLEKSFGEKDLNSIKLNFQTGESIKKWITPVFADAREDMVLGLKLSYEADSPQKAYNYVQLFGRYVQDCLLYESLYDYIQDEYSKVIAELNQNENDIIDLQFNLLQGTKKMLAIKAILNKYSELAKIENRQVVLVQEKGFSFLGPVTQLIGSESTLADMRQELANLEREKEKLLMRREYFSKCNEALTKSGSKGGMIFSQLKAIKSDVFKNLDFSLGTVKEVVNDLNIDLQTFDLAFYTNCRFLAGPTLPNQPVKTRKMGIVIFSCFLAFFFFIFLMLVLHWWQSNKKRIKSLDFK